MRKDRASILHHFVSCHVTSKSSSFPGLLNHKNVTVVMKIGRVQFRSCCSKTAEENAIKLNASPILQNNQVHQVNIMSLELDLRMLLYFFKRLSVVRNVVKTFFLETSFRFGVRIIIHGYVKNNV